MQKIVGVTFKENGKISYCLVDKLRLKKNITVIVDTDRGLQFGKVVTDIKKIDEINSKKYYKIIRISTKNDFKTHLKNVKDAKNAFITCKKIVEERNLNMQIVDAFYTFDRNQLIFRFVADNRIDFRDLAKDLAAIYKTRIELRQIGIRDKAKEVGGIGLCGRLMCCLKYEDDCYKCCKKNLPQIGQIIDTEKGKGKVTFVDILNRKYLVEVKDYGIIEVIKD